MSRDFRPEPLVLILVSAELLLAVGPGFVHLPWHAAACAWGIVALCLGMTLLHTRRYLRHGFFHPVQRKVHMGLLILACCLVIAARRDVPLLDLGSSFLGVLLFIKLLELHTPKDGRHLLLASLLPALAECFHDQSPWTGLRLLGVVLLLPLLLPLLTWSPVVAGQPTREATILTDMRSIGMGLWRTLKMTGMLVVHSFPITIILFLLSPRPYDGGEISSALRQALYGMDGPRFGGDDPAGAGKGIQWLFREERSWLSKLWDDFVAALDHGWEAFLHYGAYQQQQLLNAMGFTDAGSWWSVLGLLALLIVLSLAALLGWMVYHRWRQMDPVVRAYHRHCWLVARLGTARLPHEGPEDFARRAAGRHPFLAQPIMCIGQLYGDLRYGPDLSPEIFRQLQKQVNYLFFRVVFKRNG
ncbi:MAG: DUF3488 domain-containing protein [Magnetococcales bacterium]|nr:DUF3488 domain-containing protein [Magnetococcales bacterium]